MSVCCKYRKIQRTHEYKEYDVHACHFMLKLWFKEKLHVEHMLTLYFGHAGFLNAG